LDDLVDLVEVRGGRTSRKELAAALLYSAPPKVATLERLLRNYRNARVDDAVIREGTREGNVIVFPVRKPGPRRRYN
jgi:hypothetical protein